MIKSDSKYILMLQIILLQINAVLLNVLFKESSNDAANSA